MHYNYNMYYSLCSCIEQNMVWHPHTRRWTRHTDITGSSDVSSKNETTRQSDNSEHTKRQFKLVTRLGSQDQQPRHMQCATSFASSAVTGTERGQCKSSNELLMMWGRYPHIDTSPHNINQIILQCR
jgi:hypothetical protein